MVRLWTVDCGLCHHATKGLAVLGQYLDTIATRHLRVWDNVLLEWVFCIR